MGEDKGQRLTFYDVFGELFTGFADRWPRQI